MPAYDLIKAKQDGLTDDQITSEIDAAKKAGVDLYIDPADAAKVQNGPVAAPRPPGATKGSQEEYWTELLKKAGVAPEKAIPTMRAFAAVNEATSKFLSPLDYPANWLLGQLGKRVSAGTSAIVQPLMTPGDTPALKYAGSIARGYALGKPPEGLDPNVPTYDLMRRAGLTPTKAAVAAFGLETLGSAPLNAVGSLAAPALGKAMTATSGLPPVQAGRELVSPVARLFSRTAELTPAEKAVENAAVFQGRAVANTKAVEAGRLGSLFEKAAKQGAKVRGETPAAAQMRMVVAKENLARMPAEEAFSGLTPAERSAISQVGAALGPEPAQRTALGLKPWELNTEPTSPEGPNPVGYFPGYVTRPVNEAIDLAEGKPPGASAPSYAQPGGLSTGRMSHRSRLPSQTAEDVTASLQKQFPEIKGPILEPPAKQLRIHAAAEGIRQRNAIVVRTMLQKLGLPEGAAPKDWVKTSGLGNLSGFNEPLKTELGNLRVHPRVYRYLQTWERASLPENENALLNARAKVLQGWKPFVTTFNPEFIKRFMGWHFVANWADGVTPADYVKAAAAYAGKDPELRKALISARAIGAHGNMADISGPTMPLSEMNNLVYDLTKSANVVKNLRKGQSLQVAAKGADRLLLDYSPERFTPFLNAMRRHVAPFLAFSYQIPKAMARLAVERPGSLGLLNQAAANWNASKGFTNQQAASLLPGGEDKGVLVTGGTPINPMAQRIAANPFGHVNQLLGARGGGVSRRWDALVSLLAPDLSTLVQQGSGRSSLTGRQMSPQERVNQLKFLIPTGIEAPAEALATKEPRAWLRTQRALGLAPSESTSVATSLRNMSFDRREKLKEQLKQRAKELRQKGAK